MAPEVLQRIFEPFFTTKATGKGTGLGLAMVYGFVQRSSGALSVDSAPGEGTQICLYLPIAHLNSIEGSRNDVNPGAVPLACEGERILLVEDEDELRELATAELCDLGYTVVEAANAQQAMDLLDSAGDFDMLFSDIVMPGQFDGMALADWVGEHHPDTAVLLTSGFTGQRSLIPAQLAQRFDNILEKPYSFEELARRVRHTLDQKAARKTQV